jgi:hypothetical protein
MRSESPYYSRPSLAKAAVARPGVQLQFDRIDRWLTRFLCAFDWILVTSTNNSNVDDFPFFNRDLKAFSPNQSILALAKKMFFRFGRFVKIRLSLRIEARRSLIF